MPEQRETLIISTSLPFGTITSYFHHLARGFVATGYKVVIVLDNNPERIPEDEEYLIFRKWPNHRPTKWKDFIFFLELLEEFKPKMCLSNFGSTNIVSLASYIKQVPSRWNFVHTIGSQIYIDSGQLTTFKNRFQIFRKKMIYRLNTRLITNSEGTRQDVIDRFHIDANKVVVHTFLIASSIISKRTKEERNNCLSIVGRLAKSKGHFALLSQFKWVLSKYPDIILKIVGQGGEKDALIKEVARLDITDNVIFSGNVPNEDIGNTYAASLGHISSSYSEAFGMVNIEALREATPIICTKTGGSLDILKPSINGEYFELDNKESLLNAFEKVYVSWDMYSDGAITTFDQNYSLKNMASHVTILINKLK